MPDQKSLTIMPDLMELRNAPAPPIAMGLAGLLPFVAAPFYMIHHVRTLLLKQIFHLSKKVPLYMLTFLSTGYDYTSSILFDTRTIFNEPFLWFSFLTSLTRF